MYNNKLQPLLIWPLLTLLLGSLVIYTYARSMPNFLKPNIERSNFLLDGGSISITLESDDRRLFIFFKKSAQESQVYYGHFPSFKPIRFQVDSSGISKNMMLDYLQSLSTQILDESFEEIYERTNGSFKFIKGGGYSDLYALYWSIKEM